MASIFRQTMMARFEQRAYALRARGEGADERPPRRTSGSRRTERYYGDALELPDGYRLGWSYIPHFIHVRFYTYAYAFAHLVALLARRAVPRGSRAVRRPRISSFLANGASRSPQDLLAPLGVDLRDPETWAHAFAEFDRCVSAAEEGVGELDAG